MNILDWIVIIIIAFTTLTGIYRGFIHSALSLISFFISWLCSALFTPAVSRAFVKNDLIYSFIYNYTEGSERLTNFEYSKLQRAEFFKVNFEGSDFSGADFKGSTFNEVNLLNSNITLKQIRQLALIQNSIMPNGKKVSLLIP